MDRPEIFATLRSFDPAGLDARAYEAAVLGLFAAPFADAEAVHAHVLRRPPPLSHSALPEADLAAADAVCDNVFCFYGESHGLGPAIDWEHNPGTDHWGHDLNRFSYLQILAAAHAATQDPRYGRKGAALILDWVDKNEVAGSWYWFPERPRRDVSPYVWFSYLNIAVHLAAWTRSFELWARFWMPAELLRVLKSIHDQMAYLEQVIPTMNNNWIVIGCWGMCMTGASLPELRDAGHFLDYALAGLAREADRQVTPDGLQFELTTHYHYGVARWLCQGMRACEQAGMAVPGTLANVTARMLDYCMQTVTPDDKQVAFNDSDPDCAPRVRSLLAEEGRARGRADWLYVGTRGAEGEEPAVRSQAFPYGGVYAMRTGWTPESVLLLFDGGPAGHSHRHWDRLGFWLSAYGRSLLVDPGRYLYDAHNPYTPYLISTQAHSTITVDNEEQADRFFPATWDPVAPVAGNAWEVREAWQRVAGSHTLGYGEEGRIRVQHRRSITFWPPDVFLVLDEVQGEGARAIDSRLQLAPGAVAGDGRVWRTEHADANLAILPFAQSAFAVSVVQGQLEPTAGWYSDGVNRIEPSPTLVLHAEVDLPLRLGFVLAAYRGTDVPALDMDMAGEAIRFRVGRQDYSVGVADALA